MHILLLPLSLARSPTHHSFYNSSHHLSNNLSRHLRDDGISVTAETHYPRFLRFVSFLLAAIAASHHAFG